MTKDRDGKAVFTGTRTASQPGQPAVPCRTVEILLPPDAVPRTVTVAIQNVVVEDVAGEWDVPPVPAVAMGAPPSQPIWPRGRRIVAGRDADTYGADAFVPDGFLGRIKAGQLREWRLVEVPVLPYRYNPVTKQLQRLKSANIVVSYKRQPAAKHQFTRPRALSTLARSAVQSRVVNSAEVVSSYDSASANALTTNTDLAANTAVGYVIVTTAAIQAGSTQLANFVAAKQAKGFTVTVVTESTWGGGTGNTAAENIRAWLAANYQAMNLAYVLLIGNPHPTTGDVPMKMTYPQNYDSGYPDCPTDYYYAELTGDWDLDNDGLYGEYDHDYGAGGADRNCEVVVGRIPYYGVMTDLDSILAKTINYGNTTDADAQWRKKALLPMKPSDGSTPGYQLGEAIKADALIPRGDWSWHRVYESTYSLSPPPETTPCSVVSVTAGWTNNLIGATFWWTHGSSTSASSIMDLSHAAMLDNSHPAFTFQCSCLNSYPETTNNLTYSLLKNGGICTISGTRVTWYWIGQTNNFAGRSSNASMTYEYAKRLAYNGMPAGDALQDVKADIAPEHEVMWMNYVDFNVYGDPSLGLYTTSVGDDLGVTPLAGWSATGQAGGPFSPSETSFTLTNSGASSLTWTASKTQTWTSLSSTGGTLAPGEFTMVTWSLNSDANTLADGSYSDTLTFSNTASGVTQTRALGLTVATPTPPTITTSSSLPSGTASVIYSQTLSASGGTKPYTWLLDGGSLPSGLGLSSGGVISGTPSVATNTSFTVRVTGNDSLYSTKDFSLTINNPSPQTNIISGITTNHTGTYMVGSNGSFYGLIITNSGGLTSSGGVIGNSAISSNNNAWVTGSGSFWSNNSSLYVGATGSYNTLTVANSGRVRSTSGYIGYDASASNNAAFVTGSNSVWTNSSVLYVGYAGRANSLIITNGASVFSSGGYIGYTTNARNNLTLISGAGSLWSNASQVYAGYSGSGNQLIINNGGRLLSTNGYVGYSISASSNLVQISDVGSLWSNTSQLYVGYMGSWNQLIVANGARLVSTNSYVGYASTASNNLALISGAGSLWSNASQLYVGYSGSGNQLIVSNGAQLLSTNSHIGYSSGANNNAVTVSGAGSVWSNTLYLNVGYLGSGNQLIITNGAAVTDFIAYMGYNSSSSNNVVLVSDPGSMWNNAGRISNMIYSTSLYVGLYGSGNQLTVANGGTVRATSVVVGYGTNSVNNAIVVDGGNFIANFFSDAGIDLRRGTLTLNSGTVTVNRLLASNATSVINFNGGTLNSSSTFISNGNAFVVGGAGSGATLNLSGTRHVFANGMTIGTSGANNQVCVNSNSWVVTTGLLIGTSDGAMGNSLSLSNGNLLISDGVGGGTLDVCRGSFTFNRGTAVVDRLLATNGASSVINFYAGRLNTAGSLVSNGTLFSIGDGTQSATLNLMGGTHSFANGLVISSNGMLAGAGTLFEGGVTLTNFGTIAVGVLNQTAGGLTNVGNVVQTAGSVLQVGVGLKEGMECGFLRVQGSMTLDGRLDAVLWPYYFDSGSVIEATDVFTVLTADVPLTGVFSNVVSGSRLESVEGVGSFLVNYSGDSVELSDFQAPAELGVLEISGPYTTNGLIVGSILAGNQLIVTNNGMLISAITTLGRTAASSNNTALVIGGGSIWSNTGPLRVGNFGSGNQLMVASSGQVYSMEGALGWAGDSSNNAAMVMDSGSVWNNGSNLSVGYGGSFNQLTISNAGVAINRIGYVGYTSGADRNSILISGAGSVWSNIYASYLGYSGSFNQLTVADGGWAIGGTEYVGYAAGADSNTMTITGTGSILKGSGSFYMGYAGSGNLLIITNGGRVLNYTGYLGYGSNSTDNHVLVDGAGSLWSNNGSLYVGYGGSGNSMVISNTGRVNSSSSSYIGFAPDANNNSVLVTDAGSVWSNGSSLYVGYASLANQLTVINEGQVVVSGTLNVGNGAGAFNSLLASNAAYIVSYGLSIGGNGGRSNSVTLVNSVWNMRGSRLTLGSGAGAIGNNLIMDQNSALTNIVGLTLGDNDTTYYMTNSADGLVFNEFTTNQLQFAPFGFGGLNVGANGSADTTLVISNYLLKTTSTGYIGYSGSNCVVYVAGLGATWSNSSSLYAGYSGFNNGLAVTDGGQVFDGTGYVGSYASNDWVLVSGVGSLWSNSGSLYVGENGSGNNLAVTNGGRVVDTSGLIANSSVASNNGVVVSGTGSLWTNSGSLYVGNFGISNNLAISGGGGVANNVGCVGNNSTADKNSVVVNDSGSFWVNSGTLYVGNSGSSNSLTVANGGYVQNVASYIGYSPGAGNNAVLVTGAGSVWSNSSALSVGHSGSSNSLTVSNGGWVFNRSNVFIGYSASASNNVVSVQDAGSVWYITNTLAVGYSGSGNRLTIGNGGLVSALDATIGSQLGAVSNSALVTDLGSLWSNLSLTVGGSGVGNSLAIANSSIVTVVSHSSVGASSSSSNNSVLVTGVGSVWNGGSNLYVGNSGSSNNLTIANGGRVANGVIWTASGYIGYSASASNNSALVTGLGSVWTNNGNLYVGDYGCGNNLTIASGGMVFNNYGYIGYGSSSSNNSVLVTDPGSLWSNAVGSVLYVGAYGSSNSLTIANSGQVDSCTAFIGLADSASNNSVLVTGTGSVWRNSTFLLGIGNFGAGNQLTVSDGGWVLNGQGKLGNFVGASNNTVLVTGAGSLWSNASSLSVGGSGSFNNLTIASGGQVFSTNATVGAAVSGAHNSVLVTGTGSLWNNADDLLIGATGSFNELTITNGGMVIGGVGVIGNASLSSNNIGIVTGAGSLWTNSADLTVGNDGSFNQLTIANSGTVFGANGYVGNNAGAGNNALLVTDSGSVWSNSGQLYVGRSGSGNSLTIANGAGVFSGNGCYIGYNSAASNNSLLVTDLGSTLNVDGFFIIGMNAAGQCLTITNGGRILSRSTFAGYSAGNNTFAVSGAGSAWLVSNGFMLGASSGSSKNTLTINNGGLLVDGSGEIGGGGGNNIALITDPGSVWSNQNGLSIGWASSGNRMIVTNQAHVFSASAVFGSSSGGWGNEALITGTNSLWFVGGQITLGSLDDNNAIQVSAGATLVSSGAVVGVYSGGGYNNVAITGSSSVWTNSGVFDLGVAASFNHFVVSNGARAYHASVIIGDSTTTASNTTVISSTGSVLSSSGSLTIGNAGSGNGLTIVNGGQVINVDAYVGSNASASNNSVLVTGDGSVWTNSGVLTIGGGLGNSVTLANGGRVYASVLSNNNGNIFTTEGGSAYFPRVANAGVFNLRGGLYDLATFDNTGLFEVWNSLTVGADAGLTNRDGGSVRLVSNAAVNVSGSFVITNATLEFAGASTNATPFLPGVTFQNASAIKWAGYGSDAGDHAITGNLNLDLPSGPGLVRGIVDNATLSVDGGNGLLYVGSNNCVTLTLTNGAQVLDNVGYIGFDAASSNNSVLVDGPGSVWNSSASLFLGYSGSGNSLTVTNSGTVAASNVVIGATSTSAGNFATISGGFLYSTNADGNGSLDISRGTLTLNSGTVVVNRLYLTNNVSSIIDFNAGLLRSGGSIVSNGVVFTVGDGVQTAVLDLMGGTHSFADGLCVSINAHLVGSGSLSTPVLLNVGQFTMTGGTLSVSGALTNAAGGTFNLSGGSVLVPLQMNNIGAFIQSGGFFDPDVFTNSGSFALSGGTNIADVFLNLLSGTVTQSGGEQDVNYATNFGSWTISGGVANLTNFVNEDHATLTVAGGRLNGSLTIGNTGSFNQLTITNGGWVIASDAYIGDAATSSNNVTQVIGIGSVWSNSVNLYVGHTGSFNNLTIADGGQVFNQTGRIGNIVAARNNTALVTGSGSLWANNGSLYIGNFGSANSLKISSGGQVQNSESYIGYGSASSNNAVLVTGSGSAWSNNAVHVGVYGSSNSLTIADGGQVVGWRGYINLYAAASNNSALVTGAGSLWTNTGSMFVGMAGGQGNLTIANGGRVVNWLGYLGHDSTSSNNTALVTDAGSLWRSTADLDVGLDGGGNYLTVSNSGTVAANNIYVGFRLPSTGNVLTVSGGNLLATNATANSILEVRNGTFNFNSGTVTVNRLLATNFANSVVNFNGGTLNSGGSTFNNGSIFQVGNGTGTANLHLLGGTHSFANGLFVNTNGWLTGTGAITGVITNAGSIAPGDSPGILTVSGDLTLLTNSLLAMELAGTNNGLYDQINLDGTFTFGGALTLSLLDGFTVSAGNRFDLFDFSSSSGAFSLTNLPGLAALMYWDTSALYSSGEIEADWMTGSLQVTLAPTAAVSAGAQWQVDGGAWQNSGAIVSSLSVGSHT
ncbi:MAG: hypothetical protein HZA88_18595, partial [Verrucomicrobia bacterium]|nr:hypothetical protein [Verrucomicrobiota bacterium]